MGTPKITEAKQKQPMAEHMKSIKELLKKPFQTLFHKEKKEKKKNVETIAEKKKSAQTIPVEEILENFKKLEIEKPKEEPASDVEDEFQNFEYKVIKNESRTEKKDSQSSEDSGFAEHSEGEQEKTNADKKETAKKKTKKIQTVVLPRGPNRIGVKDYIPNVHPYAHEQIRQVNPQTFSGGQVIVNPSIQPPIDEILNRVDINVRRFEQKSYQERAEDWDIAQAFLDKEYNAEEQPSRSDIQSFDFSFITSNMDIPIHDTKTDLSTINDSKSNASVFLTPPRSENSLSPISDSHNSYYPTSDFNTMSPDMYNSDYEKYQDIMPLEEYPSCVTENLEEKVLDTSKPERASMTMKQFKDMQKEIANGFSKMECCQEKRKSCMDILKEHLHRLNIDERKDLCLKVAHLDLDHVYGTLDHILLRLSSSTEDEDLQLALFTLICEKVIALKPTLFVDEFGLNLLKTAVFCCHSRPLLTRYLVECIRVVTRGEGYESIKGHVFHEVDAVGDTLVSACARAGDTYAPVLAELVRAESADTPLFDIHHVNGDGYTALHVACMEHSASSPHMHTVHVLLQHGRADLWMGDIKGGDTAVHLAVNSAGCSLPLLLLLFTPLPRPSWKKLAHAPNRSSVTPLEYARSAIKSASRQNYPTEVLDFLKKCR